MSGLSVSCTPYSKQRDYLVENVCLQFVGTTPVLLLRLACREQN